MALKVTLPWTVFGLTEGRVTTRWRGEGAEPGQAAYLGMPRFDPSRCQDHCRECAEACLPGAITLASMDLCSFLSSCSSSYCSLPNLLETHNTAAQGWRAQHSVVVQ
jgi:ferredoxin